MATKVITRRGVVRAVVAWATVGIMTVGFAVLHTSTTEATTRPTPHGVAPKGVSELYAASCPTVTRCVAVGTATGSTRSRPIPAVTSTVNGGDSWSKGAIHGGPNQIADVSCATTKKCVAVGFSGTTPTTFTAGAAVTSNGGVSWTGRLLGGVEGTLESVACPSTASCVAVGENASSTGPTSPLVFVSSDGGASWRPGTLPNGIGGLNDVSCPSINFCLAVGTSFPTGGPSAGTIDAVYSKDGGSSWTAATSPGTGEVAAVSCANSRVCVAVGSPTGPFGLPQSLFTSDGGTTWSAAMLPSAIGSLLNVTCPSTRECIAVGTIGSPEGEDAPPADIYSHDGGRSWSTGKLPGTPAGWVYDVACSTSDRCIAVGSTDGSDDPKATATTNYTTNGGKTWR